MAHDVLDHHDGVVDQDADGERERQRRHHVEREAHRLDEGERADDRRRQRERADERRAPVAQEQEDDRDRQHRAEQQIELHRLDRGADVLGVVDQHLDARAGRRQLLERGQRLVHGVGNHDGVGVGLFAQDDGDRTLAVDLGHRALLFEPVFDLGQVAHADDGAVLGGDDDVRELLHGRGLSVRAHDQLFAAARDATARQVDALRTERIRHVHDRQAVRAQLVRLNPHVRFALAAADQLELTDAVDALEPRLEHVFRVGGELHCVGAAGDCDLQHRRGAQVELLDDRWLGGRR
jgi:hypothetical protein